MNAMTGTWSRYAQARQRAFAWTEKLPWTSKVALSLLMAGLTGLLAQVRVPLPFTPVPVTGQDFAVLLSGALLGGGYGALSQVFYVGLGTAGLGWFAECSAGVAVLFGPTGGYLLGFLPAAWLVGTLSRRRPSWRSPVPLFWVMIGGLAIIHLVGAVRFSTFMGTGFQATMSAAVLPFVVIDLVKAMAAAAVASSLLPAAKD